MTGCGSSSDGGGGGGGAPIAPVICQGSSCVSLGTAANYVILAKSGIATVPTSAVTGNLGVSPATSTAITGFALNLPSGSAFSTSSQVTGKVYAPDYAVPTPGNLTTAITDMQTAYTASAGRAANTTGLGAGSIGGLTLVPGVYKWTTTVTIPTDVTLSGGAAAVWIFQIAGDLTMAAAKKVILSGGAQSQNIFWQVAGGVSIGTTASFQGIILSQTAITLGTGASMNGRALAQTAVNIDSSTVTEP
jgi:hypothetical protein